MLFRYDNIVPLDAVFFAVFFHMMICRQLIFRKRHIKINMAVFAKTDDEIREHRLKAHERNQENENKYVFYMKNIFHGITSKYISLIVITTLVYYYTYVK